MNDLVGAAVFSFGFTQNYRIVDRKGNPWFVAMDAVTILEIKKSGHIFDDFPPNESEWYSIPLRSKNGVIQNRKIRIINEEGLFRLILKSRKPVAQVFKEKLITEILPAYRKHGIHWASLPKIWYHRGEMLNYAEWRAKKEAEYFKRFPDADLEDFMRSLPVCPPVPGKLKQDKKDE
jgi:prophage antirepressor-like protein